jgi:hypothetical protein
MQLSLAIFDDECCAIMGNHQAGSFRAKSGFIQLLGTLSSPRPAVVMQVLDMLLLTLG